MCYLVCLHTHCRGTAEKIYRDAKMMSFRIELQSDGAVSKVEEYFVEKVAVLEVLTGNCCWVWCTVESGSLAALQHTLRMNSLE